MHETTVLEWNGDVRCEQCGNVRNQFMTTFPDIRAEEGRSQPKMGSRASASRVGSMDEGRILPVVRGSEYYY